MTVFRLPRTVLRVGGADALPFLQNLVTQDLDLLERSPAVYSGLLSPQGKVQADFMIWRAGGNLLVEADAARGGDLLRRLQMFKLRAAVTVEDVSAEVTALAGIEGAPPPQAIAAGADPRRAELGWRALASPSAGGGDDVTAYHAHRIMLGVPDLALDSAPEEVFALEALFEELNGVAFHKGCFVGQENVSRMKRRATTRKKFCRIAFEGEAPAYGAAITAGGAEIGTVRTGARGAAIALLRLDRAREALDQGHSLSAAGMPVRPDPPDWLIMPGGDV